MSILRPIYITADGTNKAQIPWDRSTGRIWTTRPRATATASGITVLTDTSCRFVTSLGAGQSYKQIASPSQNLTVCLPPSTFATTCEGAEAVPDASDQVVFTHYTGSTSCGAVGPFGSILDNPAYWILRKGTEAGGYPRRVVFLINHSTAYIFIGVSQTPCFPITFTNLIPSGASVADVGDIHDYIPDFTLNPADLRRVIRYGHSGTVTVSLTDCDCP